MPWHITQDRNECKGFAVVKDETDEIIGCHTSRVDAFKHLAALYASEPKGEARAVSFTPTKEMQEEAKRGLAWRSELGRGGTAVGIARARDISNGKDLPLDTVKRMRSFFARHEVDKQAEGFSPGEPGFPSNGRIAWALWGGDPGYRWSLAIVKEADQENDRSLPLDIKAEANASSSEMRELDLEQFNSRQALQYEQDENLVELFGKYDQSSGSDGAHYVAASPFAGEGLVCANCAYYEGPRGCEIVDGDIDPNGICKRWIIPVSLIRTESASRPTNMDIARSSRLVFGETRRVNGREVEYRTVTLGQLELDNPDNQDMPMQFRGYAAVFDSPSEPLPFVESIAPGAFKRSLASGREVRMFLNHNTDQVLGSTRSGTLVLKEDERGLWVENDLPPTSVGRDLSILMQRGDVHSMSFGFSIPRGGDAWSEDGQSRELREIILHEVSVVTGFPAYPATTGASVRNIDDQQSEDEQTEAITERVGKPVDLARRYLTLQAKR